LTKSVGVNIAITLKPRQSRLLVVLSLLFQPMPLQKRPAPFDDANWLFELKYDGFRALAVIEHGRCQLISRNGNAFVSFIARHSRNQTLG